MSPGNDRGRPGEKAASNVSYGDLQNLPPATDRTTEARRRWAYKMLQRCATPPPTYGSPEWLALPEEDVLKVGGVIVAAEAHARSGDTLEADLRFEVEQLTRAFKAEEDAAYQAQAAEHREQYGRLRLVRGVAYADTEEFRNGRGEAS